MRRCTSIAIPFLQAFVTTSYFIASPTSCCPFLPAAIAAEINALSRCDDFGSSVPFGLLQFDNVTTLCITGSQQGVDVADTVDAVDRCCANVERAERELVQPRPRPGGLVFHADGLPRRPLPPSLFPSKCPPLSLSSRCFLPRFLPWLFPDVLGAALPQRLDFSIVDTFAYSRVTSEHFYSPRFGSRVFRGGGEPTHRCRGKQFHFVEVHHHQSVDAVGRLTLSVIDEFSHRSASCRETSIHARTL